MSRLEHREPTYTVIAEWEDDSSGEGPGRVTIEGADIGAATLRRVSRRLDLMVAERLEMPMVGAFGVMVRQYVEDRLADLPGTGDGYHRGLLEIHDRLDADERVEAVPVLATAMRVPEETMRACLRVARQRVNG